MKQVGLGMLLAACYGLSAALVYNRAFEGGQAPLRYAGRVADKYQTTGKDSHDYAVSSAYYARKQPGDTVTLRLYRGRLGADWYERAGE